MCLFVVVVVVFVMWETGVARVQWAVPVYEVGFGIEGKTEGGKDGGSGWDRPPSPRQRRAEVRSFAKWSGKDSRQYQPGRFGKGQR